MIFAIIKALIALGIGYLICKFVFLALHRMNFYKKQGLKTQFSPLVGSYFMEMKKSFDKRQDALADLKTFAEQNPDMKALVRNFGATPVVILLDPALKKQYAAQHTLYEVTDMFGEFFKIFTSGLVGANGDNWKKQRKIISGSFHFEFIKQNFPVIVNTAREHIEELKKKSHDGINVLAEMENITGDTVGRVFFSENLKQYTIKGKSIGKYLIDNIENVGKTFISVGYLLFGPKYIEKGFWKSHRDVLDEVRTLQDTCRKILNDRKKANIENRDLAWHLIESQKNEKEEDRLSDEIIISNYVTFILAGTNTTAITVAMTLYALALRPEVLEKLRKEISELYDTEKNPLTIDSINKMNWLTAVVKETLRVYNPGAFGPTFKMANQDHTVGEYNIKKGTIIGVASVFTFFNEKYFENPNEYNPQRWIDRPNPTEAFAYTPFWAGARNCIGQHLAQLETKIILCEFIKNFDFTVTKDYKLRMNALKGYGPEDGVKMDLKLR